MQKLFLRVKVDRAAAILAGKDEFGQVDLPVTPSTLTPAQRELLVSFRTTPAAPNISEFPDDELGRKLAAVTEADVPVLLDELVAERQRKVTAHQAELSEKYTEWRAKFLERPLAPASIVLQDNRHTSLPSKEAYVVSFSPEYLNASLKTPPTVNAPSADGLAEEILKRRSYGGQAHADIVTLRQWVQDDPEVMARIEQAARAATELQRHLAEMHGAVRRKAEAEAQEKEAAKEAQAQRREKQLSDWVANYGTATQKKRFAAKLLPEDEVLDGLREQAFAPLEDLPRYEKIKKSDVVTAAFKADRFDLEHEEVEFNAFNAEQATDEEFAVMETIQQKLPGAVTTLKEHVGFFSCAKGKDDPEVRRKSVHVELKVGELTFTRVYAAG